MMHLEVPQPVDTMNQDSGADQGPQLPPPALNVSINTAHLQRTKALAAILEQRKRKAEQERQDQQDRQMTLVLTLKREKDRLAQQRKASTPALQSHEATPICSDSIQEQNGHQYFDKLERAYENETSFQESVKALGRQLAEDNDEMIEAEKAKSQVGGEQRYIKAKERLEQTKKALLESRKEYSLAQEAVRALEAQRVAEQAAYKPRYAYCR